MQNQEKIRFQVEKFGNFWIFFSNSLYYRGLFFRKKKVLWSCSKLAQMRFRVNKFEIFWNIRDFLWKSLKKSDFKFEIWENFYKWFPYNFFSVVITCKIDIDQISREFSCLFSKEVRKNFLRNFFIEWTQIKFKENSLIFFSRRSDQFTREFPYRIY